MSTNSLRASTDLLRQLRRWRGELPVMSVYVPAWFEPCELERTLRAVRCDSFERPPNRMLLGSVIDHLVGELVERSSSRLRRARAIACFAEVGGSVVDDVWVELGAPTPIRAFVRSLPVLTPMVAALARPPHRPDIAPQPARVMAAASQGSTRS